MNSEQARIILKFHRPDRPRNTERKQLQQAIDVILGEERPQGEWIYEYDDFYHCSICGKVICTEWDKLSLKKHFPFCHCGAKMKGDQPC